MAAEDLEHNVDLVCEGGGVKGIGLAGAYSVLEERGYRPVNVAGTSAGAITAALIAAGYSSDELKKIVFGMDFRRFEDKSWEDRIPLAGVPLSILLTNGIYKGEAFLEWIRGLLAEKNVYTFADLRADWDEPKFESRLQVIASDISSRQLLVLPRDAEVLGSRWDALEVATAVRMSMSIPIFFETVRVPNPKTNHEHVIVDGGMLSNYPVWLFDRADGKAPRWPTFGLLLVEPDPKVPITERIPKPEHAPRGARGLVTLLSSMVHTMMEAHDRLYVEKAEYARTIPIPTLGVHTTEFDITHDRAQALYDSGRDAATAFLDTWNFEAYIAEFRTGKEQSRREDIAHELEKTAVA
jgi:NTE family protein